MFFVQFKGDVNEGCDWIMSTVKNGFNSQQCTIERQETELVVAEERVTELTSLLMNEKTQKVENYSAAGLMKRELNIWWVIMNMSKLAQCLLRWGIMVLDSHLILYSSSSFFLKNILFLFFFFFLLSVKVN